MDVGTLSNGGTDSHRVSGKSDIDTGDTDDTATLDTDVRREFLLEALLLNAGILSLGVGAMVLFFEVSVEGGVALLLIGTVALIATIRRYRNNAPGA